MNNELRQLVADFFARLGRLIANGVPLLSALDVIAVEKTNQLIFNKMLESIRHSLEIGHSFAVSLKKFPLFPETLITAIHNAEHKGILDEVLKGIPESIQKGDFPLGDLPPLSFFDREEMKHDEATIPDLVKKIIQEAFKAGASDVHIDPTEKGSKIRFRIDGALHTQKQQLTLLQHNAVVSRIKIMSALDVAEKRLPQDGRIIMTLKRGEGEDMIESEIDLRVSICRFFHGEKVVIRFLDQKQFPTSLEQVISGEKLITLRNWIKKPYGLILVTGPSGCGKTTTLYLMISELSTNEQVNIVTVEDPVEYLLPGINQMPIHPSIGLTFSSALRSLMRQDPDVLTIGEIRDPDTALMMSKIALSGHLVLSQLHTHDSIAAINLLLEIGVPLYSLRQILIGIVAQRLVRKLCPHCKEKMTANETTTLPEPFRSQSTSFYKSVGCEKCANIGFRGRLAIYETFEPSLHFWKMVTDRASDDALRAMIKEKKESLLDDGIRLVSEGLTTWSEVERVTFT